MAWTRDADVVCVGSGIGGVAAAITAAEQGARAVVLEKSARIGGVAAWSLGQFWVGPTSLSEAAGLSDTDENAQRYLEFLGSGYGDAILRAAFVRHAREAVDFFVRLGVEFEVIRRFPDYYYPKLPFARPEGRYLEVKPFALSRLGADAERLTRSPHGYGVVTNADFIGAGGDPMGIYAKAGEHIARNELCAGAGAMAALIQLALAQGVEFMTESPAIALIGGQVGLEGVVAKTPTGEVRIRVKQGIVLATGGYDHNATLVEQFEHAPGMASMAPPTVTGDHFALAGDVGGFIAALPSYLTPHPLGIVMHASELEHAPMYFAHLPGQPHSIVVNREGRRFADEAFYHDHEAAIAHFDGRRHRPVNWPAWLVFDQDFRDRYQLGPFPPGAPLPNGAAHMADSLKDLATLAGFDAEGLIHTVSRFNEFCRVGVDADFGRGEFPWSHIFVGDLRISPNPNLGPIARPPFYAMKLEKVATSFASAGLLTNQDAQVLTARGVPIPGLYAVGNAAARLDAGGYNSGIANTRGLAFGFAAAKHMRGDF